ncbi:MAG: hypothetical protein WCK48_01515 [bacterium]
MANGKEKTFEEVFGFTPRLSSAVVLVEGTIVVLKLREIAARFKRATDEGNLICTKYNTRELGTSDAAEALKDLEAATSFEKLRDEIGTEWTVAITLAKNAGYATRPIEDYYPEVTK